MLPELNRQQIKRSFTSQLLKSNIPEEQLLIKQQCQIEALQKQLDYQMQNKSFVMKLQNQRCTLCIQLKVFYSFFFIVPQEQNSSIDKQVRQEKIQRKQLEVKLQELQKKLQESTIITLKQKPITIKENEKWEKIKNWHLVDEFEPEMLTLCNYKQIESQEFDLNQTIAKLLKENTNLKNEITYFKENMEKVQQGARDLQVQLKSKQSHIDQIIQQSDQLNQQLRNERETNVQLQMTITKLQSQLDKANEKHQEQFKLPNDIIKLKRIIDSNIDNVTALQNTTLEQKILQLEWDKAKLQQKLIDQEKKVDQNAKQTQISKSLLKVEQFEIELFLLLNCQRCKELLVNPHTYIPCGHTYCSECFSDQKKVCYICESGDHIQVSYKIFDQNQAIYRNISIDQLIKVYNAVKDAKILIKSCLLAI